MKAAILAAGDSTRMLPLSANTPKHLLPVGGEPLIFHTLRGLRDAGIDEVLVITGYHEKELRDRIGAHDWESMTISYITQTERKGTAHAAALARDFAGNDEILIMYGDLMVQADSFAGLIKAHQKSGMSLTLSVIWKEDPSAYGAVVVDDQRVIDIVEKPEPGEVDSSFVNAGIYVAGPDLWDAIEQTELSPRGEYEITDSIKILIKRGVVGFYELPSWWIDVGRPWDLLEANKLFLDSAVRRIEGEVEEGAVLKGNVIVERGAIVRSGAYIIGPVFIGPECVVGPNCFIRPHTALVRKVKIGNAVEIKNSIIMEGTNVGHLSYVGDSIIGRNSNFGAGTITANLRHDDQPIKVTVKSKRVSSGRRKLGAIIGDDVKTGIGTSIAPGVVIHTGARTGVGVIVDRDIPPHKLLLATQLKKLVDI
ncbi:MAG: glucose-1-phosphate thymidylyltransferase [Candidatus Thorarchaeota archaeon]|nr:MAG: glucose-1-phosphate thymidylyltransferase [Candidatus Thorarchaeota archaeon]RLI62567.1 MAG: glucose-1-phosphate thymidylyltransferase [Candidatus Thorarchaeota archaeon]